MTLGPDVRDLMVDLAFGAHLAKGDLVIDVLNLALASRSLGVGEPEQSSRLDDDDIIEVVKVGVERFSGATLRSQTRTRSFSNISLLPTSSVGAIAIGDSSMLRALRCGAMRAEARAAQSADGTYLRVPSSFVPQAPTKF